MLNNKTIAVVVPAYNESSQIKMVLDSMPDFVDRIIVVDDCSKDDTAKHVKDYFTNNLSPIGIPSLFKKEITPTPYNKADVELWKKAKKEIDYFTPSEVLNQDDENERIVLIQHKKNGGVGAAIASGYKWCKDHNIFCSAVMAGDGQMDPSELESICSPIINEEIDYVKGNRLIHQSAWVVIPKVRFFWKFYIKYTYQNRFRLLARFRYSNRLYSAFQSRFKFYTVIQNLQKVWNAKRHAY